ncbi:hypothetical protein BJP36_38615 [Moorena producens JHB]|uniref:Uncharacterized protein n=1 Tax=Moorena producens (strain JHB) TaxID=1454205 RepID=A0A9Q9SUP4_MOOP1|nr:hypothetical protein [Moorena producens]WAN69988.1 hypothetical protein BJP36_38615 [Moorena producens JHB]
MGETTAVAHGGSPHDRAASLQRIYLKILRRDPRAVYLPIGMRASRTLYKKSVRFDGRLRSFTGN